jgi:hypothetical protein
MADLTDILSVHKTLAESTPRLRRGIVWCTVCGRELKVDSAHCLAKGWPMCHGYTMTLDSPEERALHADHPSEQVRRGPRAGQKPVPR